VREVPVPGPLAAPQATPRFRHRITTPDTSPPETGIGKEVMALTVSLSAALLLGAAVFLLCRYSGLKILHAAVCIVFGFYLASSSLAPDIANITASLFRLL
jgi:hypothetical protein